MPISRDLYTFCDDNVEIAPTYKGVYALYKKSGNDYYTIYIGKAEQEDGIRGRLRWHKQGNDKCTNFAVAYRREPHSNPAAREKELLLEYRSQYGKLPECNERIG